MLNHVDFHVTVSPKAGQLSLTSRHPTIEVKRQRPKLGWRDWLAITSFATQVIEKIIQIAGSLFRSASPQTSTTSP